MAAYRPPNLNLNFLRKFNENENSNKDPCEEKWNNGITYSRNFLNREFISVRGDQQCKLLFNNTYIYINLKNFDRDAYLNDIPITEGRPINDGYYTWIIYSNEGVDKKFVCCKAISVLEIGTIHKDIAERVSANKIHAAGEIYVNNNDTVFNLISGTYMLPALKSKRSRCYDFESHVIEKVKTILGNDISFTDRTLITRNNLPVTQKEIDLYLSYGAKIDFYKNENECIIKRMSEGGSRKKNKLRRKGKYKSRRKGF